MSFPNSSTMGDALTWAKAEALAVIVVFCSLLLLASQQLRAKLFSACIRRSFALRSQDSSRECWAEKMKNYRAMHEQLLLQLAPLLAEENEAPEVMKERFRKRRSIGVLTRTGADGVKRAHFFGRAGVRPLRPPKTGFHFPEAETSTSSASAGVLLYSEQQGGGRAISSEAEQKQVRHLLLNNELHPFVIGRLARSPSCTSSASTSCEMTSTHESTPFSSSDEESDGDDLDHTHGEVVVTYLILYFGLLTYFYSSFSSSTTQTSCCRRGRYEVPKKETYPAICFNNTHGEDSDAGPPHLQINGQHRTRRMFKALAVGIYPAALQPHKDDHEDTRALAKEEKQKTASSTDMQNQTDENHASCWRDGDHQKCKMLTNKADKRAILGSFTPGQGRRESAAVAWRK